MLLTLAFRHLLVKPLRSLVLLGGFALGVGVMLVLLSVGEAMLAQARDVKLVGGGEVTVLPQGIDIEAMRSGGVSGMFFGIDRARFVVRQLLGGPRQAGVVRAVSPAIEQKLLYLAHGGRVVPVRAGGEIPSRAAAAGAGLEVRAGTWRDGAPDRAWVAPTRQQLYDELDHFHLPPTADSTWAEWHYFNVVTGPDEWWYVTLLVGGAVRRGPWGGQVLVTHHRPGAPDERFAERADSGVIALDTARADLRVGAASVEQRDGTYRVRATVPGAAGPAVLDLLVRPKPERYFPPVELRADGFLSGYVVPGLAATADGSICAHGRCTPLAGATAYHDHNWGVWREVTWEWGAGQGAGMSLLYGGVRSPADSVRGSAPFFLALVDSLGVRQVLRFRRVRYSGRVAAAGAAAEAPAAFDIVAAREADTVRLHGTVQHAAATAQAAAGYARAFLQLRAAWTLDGRIAGAAVRDSGSGFFETYVPLAAGRGARR